MMENELVHIVKVKKGGTLQYKQTFGQKTHNNPKIPTVQMAKTQCKVPVEELVLEEGIRIKLPLTGGNVANLRKSQ